MNKIIHKVLVSLSLILLLSCNSEDIRKDTGIIGTWQLVEMYSDPGDGSGTFNPVKSEKTIKFISDGTFNSNGDLCRLSAESSSPSVGTFSEASQTITPSDCELNVDLAYEINSDQLIVYHFCIEGCGEKFKKLK